MLQPTQCGRVNLPERTITVGADHIDDLKSLDPELAKESMRGLWAREEAIRREPAPFGKPMLWKWAKIRVGLEAAGQLITTN
jgi:gentisate 1,2-dioxygenase